MKANQHQIGGNHYQTENKLQHWDAVYEIFGGDYLIGNATKYLARLGKKGDENKSIEDLEKAIHYLEKKLELMKNSLPKPTVNYSNTTPIAMPSPYGYVPPSNPVKEMTLGDIIRKQMEDEGFDTGSATKQYTNQD